MGILNIDKKTLGQLETIITDFKELLTDLQNGNFKKQICEEACTEIYENLDTIFETCIDKYYSEYSPQFYSRKGSLYEVYDLKINGFNIKWKFDSSFMTHGTHRVSNEYIYEKMFKEGWHGGADKGENHPHPGIPWYRSPVPHLAKPGEIPYSRWSDSMNHGYGAGAAKKSFISPYKNIDREINNYESGKSKIIGYGIKEVMEHAEDLVMYRYAIFNY